jgi:hypothetical protein
MLQIFTIIPCTKNKNLQINYIIFHYVLREATMKKKSLKTIYILNEIVFVCFITRKEAGFLDKKKIYWPKFLR